MDKKGQQRGLVTGYVVGITGLIIAFLIAFLVVSSLTGSEDLLPSVTNTTINESQNTTSAIVFANGSSAYRVRGETGATVLHPRGFIVTDAWTINDVAYQDQLNATFLAFLSIDDDGFLTNTTILNSTRFSNISISYTDTSDGNAEGGVTRLSANFTEGADNVSTQIPTILLIAIIVLVLGVLGVLIETWRRMRLTGSL